jgi:YggT family protein
MLHVGSIPPVAGVDITPIVWVSILSFISEILTGPQGLLNIIERKGGL